MIFVFQVHTYNKAEACRMLNGTNIFVTGCSLMRQLFIGLLTILKGDANYGSLRPNAAPGENYIAVNNSYKSESKTILVFNFF